MSVRKSGKRRVARGLEVRALSRPGSRAAAVAVLVIMLLVPVANAGLAGGTGPALWGTNGTVTAVVRSGNTLFVGGAFTEVGPCTGSGIPLDRRTGVPEPNYPKVVGSIAAVASDGNGGWYIGGSFDHVGGQPRHNLAHILANGEVSPWAPEPDRFVDVLAVRGGVVYAGGGFSTIGGCERSLVAELDGETGWATDWNAHAEGGLVTAIAIRGGTMFVGGGFTRMGGEACSNLAALDLRTATATGWRPALLTGATGGLPVCAVAVDEATVYVGGNFAWVDGVRRDGLAAIDRKTGALKEWDVGPVRPSFPWYQPPMVSALAIQGNTLFAGGCFEKIGGQLRNGLAAIDTRSGRLLPWFPNPAGGSPYTYLDAMEVAHNTVYVGGYFASMGGEERRWLAAVDALSGAVLPWNPRPNSEVRALAASGAAVYAGGYFTSLGNWQRRTCLAALDATTGELMGWDARLAGYQVHALAVRGSTLYVGGDFSEVGGLGRSNLAAFDVETASPVSWAPRPGGPVWSLALSDSVLYVGGLFGSIGGQARRRIAAIRLTDGTATAWDPNADDGVATLAVGPGTIYAGGLFGRIGGQVRSRIAALDPVTGSATSWDAAVHSWGWVNSIAVEGSTVYVGGRFISVAGELRNNLAAVDAATGAAMAWNPDADGEVEAVCVSSDRVYAGGFFRSVSGRSRRGLVAIGATSAAVADWNPIPDAVIWALFADSGTLYAGGNFGSVGYLPQANIAAIPLSTTGIVHVAAAPLSVGSRFGVSIEPNPSRTDAVVRFTAPTPGQVRLAFYDLQGRQIATILDREALAAGPREVHVSTAEWPAGTYFCRLEGPGGAVTRKLIVLK